MKKLTLWEKNGKLRVMFRMFRIEKERKILKCETSGDDRQPHFCQ